ncbi:enoyl-CoA hydratase-related protein [Pseudooceanicola sp. LIPI14-2-Ac024]|uniref:enoyl-CoA hydratase-related protein n=1 Tax=Pseudooceanicola sp. LIPI14-2-Ac024 TaxID=3344875 RepID=UPI0035D0D00D
MAGQVTIEREGDVAVIAVDHPPAQVLTPTVRSELMDALDKLARDDAVRAILLGTSGGGFPGPVNPREFDGRMAAPTPADLARRIETMPKPVVAVIAGTVTGAGAELALAARARIGLRTARIGFSDGLLGLPPSAGASQRLPRLIGARNALTLLLTGRNYPVASEVARDLFDQVLTGREAQKAAIARARALAAQGDPATEGNGHMGDPVTYQDDIARRRAVMADDDDFAAAVIDGVEAAQLLPLDAGLELERSAFDEIVTGDRARALRHIAVAEARVAAGIKAPPVQLVGVLADGPEAPALCARLARRGVAVIVYQPDTARAQRFRARLHDHLGGSVAVQARADMAGERAEDRVVVQTDRGALTTAEVLLDLSDDDGASKTRALAALGALDGSTAPVLSLTRHLDVAGFAPEAARKRVIGLHLPERSFPARVAELAVRHDTDPGAEARARRLMQQMRRLPVRVAATDGLAGPALAAAMFAAADALVRLGADPLRIDAAMEHFGMARGPYRLIGEMAPEAQAALQQRRGRPGGLSGLIARAGLRLGTGHDAAAEAAVLSGLVARARGGAGASDEDWPDAEIQTALLTAIVNEGAVLLERGTVARPLVLDVVMVQGYGFPRARGGPMQAADAIGLGPMIRAMQALEPLDTGLWHPAPALEALMHNDMDFSDLNS